LTRAASDGFVEVMDDEPRAAPPFAALDTAFEAGWRGLERWYRRPDDAARARHATLGVRRIETRRAGATTTDAPLVLELEGAAVARLVARIGRGNNSDVYLTQDGHILKLARTTRAAKKLLLQAWTAPRLGPYGIRAARVLALDRDGLFLVQERVRGPTVRDAWRHESTLTDVLRLRLRDEITRLRALGEATGLWIDLRDRDVFLARDGAIVHVDYGPRVHMDGSTTYAAIDPDGARRHLGDDEALSRFLGVAPPTARSA